jgi:hypothetical protein
MMRRKHGEVEAAELQATDSCLIISVRSMDDRGQEWDEPQFAEV